MPKKHFIIPAIALYSLLNVATAQVAGPVWQQTSAPGPQWRSIACSADGTKLVAICISCSSLYLSTNSGATWTPSSASITAATFAPHSVASSADGKILAAAGGAVYVSVDSGATWTSRLTTTGVYQLIGIAMSADGTKLVAAEQSQNYGDNLGQIYTSSDSGSNWTLRLNGPAVGDIACSPDGTKLIAGGGSVLANAGGYLYLSTNSGVNWTTNTGPGNNYWTSVACSADGTKLFATEVTSQVGFAQPQFGLVHVSTNSGASWDNGVSSAALNWMSIACSSNGNFVVAASANQAYFGSYPSGIVYTSTNSGQSWQLSYAPDADWWSVACSSDGTKLYGASKAQSIFNSNGGIYTYVAPPTNSPTMDIASGGGKAFVSWPWPSSGFVLQQNTNLAPSNWVTLSNVTAVVNQAIVPQTNANNFYRLMMP